MEQNLDTSAPIAPVIENNKQNGGNGLKIITVIACIVAACGIGFGVYGMIQSSQKDSQISNLKAQISGQVTDIDKTTVAEGDSTNQREQGYLYLDEFGIKIKLPDNALVTSYAYSSGYYGLTYTNIKDLGTYEIWAIPKDQNGLNYSLNTTRDWAVRISRYSKTDYDCQVSCGKEIFLNDEYIFTINPQNSTISNYDGTIDEELSTAISDFVYNQYSNNSGFFDKEDYSEI